MIAESIYTTPEHELLRDQVARFLAREVEPHAAAWEEQGFVPREVLRRMGQAGLFGLMYEGRFGGGDADALTNLVFAEALSQSTFAGFIITVLVHTDMASPHLHHAGNGAQKEKYLKKVIAGELITAVGITEPGAGSDVAGIRTSARREGDEWVLNGTKMFITNGVHANLYFVAAKTGTGKRDMSMFIVEKGTPGFSVGRALKKTGWLSSDTAELIFDNVDKPLDLQNASLAIVPTQLACRLLFTTRRLEPTFPTLVLGVLAEPEARTLLLSGPTQGARREPGLMETATTICRTLGCLPLALALAAAYLDTHPRITLAGYLRGLVEKGAILVTDAGKIDPLKLPTQHEKALQATLEEQWAALRADGEARRVLQTAALLGEAAQVPRARLSLLTGLSDRVEPWREAPLEEALQELARGGGFADVRGAIGVIAVSYTHLTLPTNREV